MVEQDRMIASSSGTPKEVGFWAFANVCAAG
jgi:hypothetical protein